jgi:glycine/D-amino acid oxidase-like deaminating enzyme
MAEAALHTQVLVVGAGPVGLTLAVDLGQRGVRCVLVERKDAPQFLPKMERCNARTMEIYRRMGLAEKIRRAGFPRHYPMDTVVVREAVYRQHPWVVHSLYKAFVAAKAWCLEQMRFSGALRYTVPWLHAELEETEAVLGEDPWPYGLEPNRKTLETLLRYLVEQGFVDRARPVEEFFAPVTVVNE